jgi:hypothetical protein
MRIRPCEDFPPFGKVKDVRLIFTPLIRVLAEKAYISEVASEFNSLGTKAFSWASLRMLRPSGVSSCHEDKNDASPTSSSV